MAIPNYPKLYNLQGNNKIYEWSIKIEKTSDSFGYLIITSHGQTNGKQIVHTNEIKEGKAKRTSLEQAILESNRKWENKKTKELYCVDINNINNSNNSVEMIVRPMLANKFIFELYKNNSKAFKIQLPAFVQKKYDGIRCLSYIKNGKVILESRKGVEFENFEILKSQLKKLLEKFPENFYLDGELYTQQLDFEVISGLVRMSEKKCSLEDKVMINEIEYHIYDIFDTNQPELTYQDRYLILKNMIFEPLCKKVETFIAKELFEIKDMHDAFVQDGFEGIMVRDMNGKYEPNKRSKYLQKYKVFMEEEFEIIGFHEGSGDEKGAIVWECKTHDNKSFAVRPKGTFEFRKKLFDNGSTYIGKMLTVIFQEYSSDNVPRFPVGKALRDEY
jgi:ATP-dependent DNA ligase